MQGQKSVFLRQTRAFVGAATLQPKRHPLQIRQTTTTTTHTIIRSTLEPVDAPIMVKIVINDASLLSHSHFFIESNFQSTKIFLFRHDLFLPRRQGWWWCQPMILPAQGVVSCRKHDAKRLGRQFRHGTRQETGCTPSRTNHRRRWISNTERNKSKGSQQTHRHYSQPTQQHTLTGTRTAAGSKKGSARIAVANRGRTSSSRG